MKRELRSDPGPQSFMKHVVCHLFVLLLPNYSPNGTSTWPKGNLMLVQYLLRIMQIACCRLAKC